jgi:four helix bundle protein
MSDYKFPFEKLRVWQDARSWVKGIYLETRTFPADEKFGMTSQLNRAAVSGAANLAEGSSRTSPKDQAHFSQLAYGSLMESACLLILAEDLGYTKNPVYPGSRV